MEDWVGLGTTMVSKQSSQDRYVMEITVISSWDRHARQALRVELTTSRAESHKACRSGRDLRGANWAVAQGPPQIRGLHKNIDILKLLLQL